MLGLLGFSYGVSTTVLLVHIRHITPSTPWGLHVEPPIGSFVLSEERTSVLWRYIITLIIICIVRIISVVVFGKLSPDPVSLCSSL